MGRPKGSKNLPKPPEQHIQALREHYTKLGKDFKIQIVDPNQTPIVDEPERFEIEPDKTPAEIDNYQCGACNAVFPTPLSKCPNCGVSLNWKGG